MSPRRSSDRSGGVGGAPPLRSIGGATVPHSAPTHATPFPTFPSGAPACPIGGEPNLALQSGLTAELQVGRGPANEPLLAAGALAGRAPVPQPASFGPVGVGRQFSNPIGREDLIRHEALHAHAFTRDGGGLSCTVRRPERRFLRRRRRSAPTTSSTAPSATVTSRTARCAATSRSRTARGPNAIKEQSLDASKFNAAKIGKVTAAALADGIARHGVVSSAGALVRGRGVTSAAKTGDGQYQVIFDVRRAQLHLLRDARRRVGLGARHGPDLGHLGRSQRERRAGRDPQQRRQRDSGPLLPPDGLLLTGRVR